MNKLSFKGIKVLLLGDIMLDRYLYGHVNRLSPEAPVPVLDFSHSEAKMGGAANVALNLKVLGAEVSLISIVGDDDYGRQLKSLLTSQGFNDNFILEDPNRKTTVKTRVISGVQQLMRVDEENTFDISDDISQQIIDQITLVIKKKKADVLIFQDYNKGLLTKKLITKVINLAREQGVFIAVDPKEKNFFAYTGVDLFKPNLKEMEEALKRKIEPKLDDLINSALQLHDKIFNKYTLISLSEHGVFIGDHDKAHVVPTTTRNIVDVCGAGDAVLSIAALSLFKGTSLKETAYLSNLAGGNVCESQGVSPINIEKMNHELLSD